MKKIDANELVDHLRLEAKGARIEVALRFGLHLSEENKVIAEKQLQNAEKFESWASIIEKELSEGDESKLDIKKITSTGDF